MRQFKYFVSILLFSRVLSASEILEDPHYIENVAFFSQQLRASSILEPEKHRNTVFLFINHMRAKKFYDAFNLNPQVTSLVSFGKQRKAMGLPDDYCYMISLLTILNIVIFISQEMEDMETYLNPLLKKLQDTFTLAEKNNVKINFTNRYLSFLLEKICGASERYLSHRWMQIQSELENLQPFDKILIDAQMSWIKDIIDEKFPHMVEIQLPGLKVLEQHETDVKIRKKKKKKKKPVSPLSLKATSVKKYPAEDAQIKEDVSIDELLKDKNARTMLQALIMNHQKPQLFQEQKEELENEFMIEFAALSLDDQKELIEFGRVIEKGSENSIFHDNNFTKVLETVRSNQDSMRYAFSSESPKESNAFFSAATPSVMPDVVTFSPPFERGSQLSEESISSSKACITPTKSEKMPPAAVAISQLSPTPTSFYPPAVPVVPLRHIMGIDHLYYPVVLDPITGMVFISPMMPLLKVTYLQEIILAHSIVEVDRVRGIFIQGRFYAIIGL